VYAGELVYSGDSANVVPLRSLTRPTCRAKRWALITKVGTIIVVSPIISGKYLLLHTS